MAYVSNAELLAALANIENTSMVETIARTGFFNGKIGKVFNILGRRNGFTSTTVFNDIKEFDNAVANIPVLSNSNLDIISSSALDIDTTGTGVRTVTVVYINSVGAIIQSPPIALNGTTLVTNVLTGVNEVIWMETKTAGTGLTAAGNIRLRINGGTVEVEQITAGSNRSMSARIMIPTGYTGYIINMDASAISSNQDIRLRATLNSFDNTLSAYYHFLENIYLVSGIYAEKSLPYFKIPGGARVKVSTISSSTPTSNRADVSFTIILLEN